MRILTARSIVAARRLDRFPTRKRGEQFTQQRRLTDIRSVTTNTDYQRSIHCHLPPSSAAATKVWRSHLQPLPADNHVNPDCDKRCNAPDYVCRNQGHKCDRNPARQPCAVRSHYSSRESTSFPASLRAPHLCRRSCCPCRRRVVATQQTRVRYDRR